MRHILIILIILLSYSGLKSGEISVNDTLARRGEVIDIPVYYSFDKAPIPPSEIVFNFDAEMLNIISVFGKENSLLDDTLDFTVDIDVEDYNNSKLTVTIEDTISAPIILDTIINYLPILFYIRTEALAGSDSLAEINPIEVISEDPIADSITFNGGIVTIPDPVRETSETVFGNFRPNPFNGASKSYLYLNLETDIKISAYNISGQKSISLICSEDCTDNFFQITDKNGNLVPDENKLDPGEYFIHIKNSNMLSAGAYLVVLSTDYEVITRKFIIIK